jgi:hypothetical protein
MKRWIGENRCRKWFGIINNRKHHRRWINRPHKPNYEPTIAEHDLINENKEGDTFLEMIYILINDVPDKYRESFEKWANSNNKSFCIERIIFTVDGEEVECIEKKAVNVIDWERWYGIKGINIEQEENPFNV